MFKKKCLICKKEFWVIPYRKDKAKFCSRDCCSKHQRLHPQSSCFKKGCIHRWHPWDKGIKRPEISREKHPNWKGGITPKNRRTRYSIEMRLWREAVFARDNWTCQKTGIKGGKLIAHHIKNFADCPELKTSIKNGITLLKSEHDKFHKIYGWKNNTKEQLDEFLIKTKI